MTTKAAAAQPSTSWWLQDALGVLGAYAGAYANNRLAYESARDEIELNNLRMQGYMRVAQTTASVQGNQSIIPEKVGGVPTGVLMVGMVLAVAAVIWAAK